MRILQIATQIPYPLLDGGKVGIFNITKHLARRGHEITLLAFDREDTYNPGPLPQLCDLIPIKHSTKNSPLGGLVNLFSGLPYNIAKYTSRPMEMALRTLLRSKQFDVVHVDHLHMARYGLLCKALSDLPIVLREHNIESTIVERYAETQGRGIFRIYMNEQVQRIRRYEAAMTAQFDACCVITENDRKRLEELQPSVRARIVSGGVEAKYFADTPGNDIVPHSISFFGGLNWQPNQDAILWFHRHVFPIVREKYQNARLVLIGKSPSPEIQALESDAVIIKGFVPDLMPEIRKYQVTVAPLRIGGGIRLKLLESFAMRVPAVSTSVGCEGILARHDEHLLIADDAKDFASCVLQLFEDTQLRERLVQNAYNLVDAHYRWEYVARQLEGVYGDVIEKKRGSGSRR